MKIERGFIIDDKIIKKGQIVTITYKDDNPPETYTGRVKDITTGYIELDTSEKYQTKTIFLDLEEEYQQILDIKILEKPPAHYEILEEI